MERITSFCVDHTKLTQGIYVSRVDGDIITYDIRMIKPNIEKAIDPKAAHTIEHIGATLLRNSQYKDQIIYFGPMGCMTGFYLLVRNLDLNTVIDLVKEIFEKISTWHKNIPGATKEECGNYQYMDLDAAKSFAKQFIESSWEHSYHYL